MAKKGTNDQTTAQGAVKADENIVESGKVEGSGAPTEENPTVSASTEEKPTDSAPKEEKPTVSPLPPTRPEVAAWVKKMSDVPIANVKGAGPTQENRCTHEEIQNIINASTSLYGVEEPTALTGVSEMIRRGGANASTPASFTVEIKCETQNVIACITKGEIASLVSRHANGKTMRNLAEGMAEAVVIFGVELVRRNPGLDRPGDLAKKVDNRLSYEKKPPLTPEERVGCASYAQWLPHLDQLVGSDRLKSLLAQDLELRKQGRVKPQPTAEGGGKKDKSDSGAKTPKGKGKKGQGKKGQGKKGGK